MTEEPQNGGACRDKMSAKWHQKHQKLNAHANAAEEGYALCKCRRRKQFYINITKSCERSAVVNAVRVSVHRSKLSQQAAAANAMLLCYSEQKMSQQQQKVDRPEHHLSTLKLDRNAQIASYR